MAFIIDSKSNIMKFYRVNLIYMITIFTFKTSHSCEILPEFINQNLKNSNPFFNSMTSILFLDHTEEIWSSKDMSNLFNFNIAVLSLSHFTIKEQENWFKNNLKSVEDSWIISEKARLLQFTPYGTWIVNSIEESNKKMLRLDSSIYQYKCNDDNSVLTMNEVYAVKNKYVMENQKVVQYDANEDIITYFANPFMWERRQNLTGITIINSVLEWDNFMFIEEKDGQILYNGFLPELVKSMQKIMNFDVEWTSPEDGEWGIKNASGEWNGIIEDLRTKKADLCSAGLTVTADRRVVVDFTAEIIEDPITLVTLKPKGEEMNFNAFIYIFKPEAWIIIIICLIISAIALACISCKLNHKIHVPSDSEEFNIINAIGFVFMVMLQRDYTIVKGSQSSKLLSLVTCFFAFLIFTYYSAFLTSIMTTTSPPAYIESFQDVLDQDLDLVLWPSSSYEQLLVGAKSGSPMRKV